jgi:hypothetical protein
MDSLKACVIPGRQLLGLPASISVYVFNNFLLFENIRQEEGGSISVI